MSGPPDEGPPSGGDPRGNPPSQTDAGEDADVHAFLIADFRGYTRFTQEHGDEGAARLAQRFAEVTRTVMADHRGRVIELRGDEAVAVFGSPRSAIRAAVALQQRFVDETIADPSLPLTVGIGLDAGEAVPVEGGYRGGALNVAGRLCSIAGAGEVLASREIAYLARRVEGVRFTERGQVALKGLDQPVHVIAVRSEERDAAEAIASFVRLSTTPALTSRWQRKAVAAGAALAVLASVIVVAVPLLRSGETVNVGSNSIARLNAEDGSLEFATPLGQRPGASAIGFGSLWVVEPDRGVVARVNLEDGSVEDTIRVGPSPAGVAAGEGSVWVTNAGDGTVSRINIETNEESARIVVGSRPTGIAVGAGALWVADGIGAELLRVDPISEKVQAVPLSGEAAGVAFTREGVWVSVAPSGVARVDPASLSAPLAHNVGSGPTAVLPAFGSIWVANHVDDTVSRLEPSTGRVEAQIPVGDGPNALGDAAGSLWVANEFDGSIAAINPATNAVERTLPVGGAVASLGTDGADLWLAVGASASEHLGGTLTVSSEFAPSSLDPAMVGFNDPNNPAGQILSVTNDGLLTFRKVGGADGGTLVADLASALPQVSADGTTYRFPLREGILYSTGDPVRPEDFRYAVERAVSMNPDLGLLMSAIGGANSCAVDPTPCDLSDSIVVDDGAVTFHLTRPDPDLPNKLTLPAFFPVPTATPIEDQGLAPVPATGPYMIVEAGDDRIELVRNRAFLEWSGAAQPAGFVDAISWQFGERLASAFDRLVAGELDWMTDPPRPADLASLQAAHPNQVVLSPGAVTRFVGFDVRKPPFNDKRVRQAVNYALDRDHVVELFGGPTSQRTTCQIIPPSFPGYDPYCPYTLEPDGGEWSAPDLDRAKDLIEAADAVDEKVIVLVADPSDWAGSVETMRYVVGVLNELGLRAKLRIVDGSEYYDAILAGGTHVHLSGWAQNYPSAGDFITPQFRCGEDFNLSGLCNESLDAQMGQAQRLQASDPAAANRAWIEIEHQLVDDAIFAPLTTEVSAYAFSARTENIQVHPLWGILLSRLWVQ